MPYPAKAVANFFLEIAKQEHSEVTPMKLLKLVYFAHGWHLGLTGMPLIDETVEAWKFGPVVPSLYHHFKGFGMGPITRLAYEATLDCISTPRLPEKPGLTTFLKKIWEVYGKLEAVELSNITHLPDSPWTVVWEKTGKEIKGTDIPNEAIKAHFELKRQENARS